MGEVGLSYKSDEGVYRNIKYIIGGTRMLCSRCVSLSPLRGSDLLNTPQGTRVNPVLGHFSLKLSSKCKYDDHPCHFYLEVHPWVVF